MFSNFGGWVHDKTKNIGGWIHDKKENTTGWLVDQQEKLGDALEQMGQISAETGASDYDEEMANLAKLQAKMAADKHNFWRTDYKPWQKEQIEANRELIPHELDLMKTQLINAGKTSNLDLGMKTDERQKSTLLLDLMKRRANAEKDIMPHQTGLIKDQISSRRELIPLETLLRRQEISARQQLTPLETNLARQRISSRNQLIPLETDLAKEQISSRRQLLPLETNLARQQITEQGKNIDRVSGLSDLLVSRAREGTDINGRVNEASADVAHSYKDANSNYIANSRRLGVGGMINGLKQNSLNKAKDLAFARTNARNQAKNEDFRRIGNAMSLLR